MSTLQERLRRTAEENGRGTIWSLITEAADRLDDLEREVEALRADADRWRYVVTHASWYRHDDGQDRYSRMCVRLPYDADQSCVATRTAAIDAARSKS